MGLQLIWKDSQNDFQFPAFVFDAVIATDAFRVKQFVGNL